MSQLARQKGEKKVRVPTDQSRYGLCRTNQGNPKTILK